MAAGEPTLDLGMLAAVAATTRTMEMNHLGVRMTWVRRAVALAVAVQFRAWAECVARMVKSLMMIPHPRGRRRKIQRSTRKRMRTPCSFA